MAKHVEIVKALDGQNLMTLELISLKKLDSV